MRSFLYYSTPRSRQHWIFEFVQVWKYLSRNFATNREEHGNNSNQYIILMIFLSWFRDNAANFEKYFLQMSIRNLFYHWKNFTYSFMQIIFLTLCICGSLQTPDYYYILICSLKNIYTTQALQAVIRSLHLINTSKFVPFRKKFQTLRHTNIESTLFEKIYFLWSFITYVSGFNSISFKTRGLCPLQVTFVKHRSDTTDSKNPVIW